MEKNERAFLTQKILETFDGDDQDSFNEFVEELNQLSDDDLKGMYNVVKN